MALNLLQQWEQEHRKKILEELRQAGIDFCEENIPRIIEETSFRVRSKKHPNECPYYLKTPPSPCHNIKDLNCFLCACPEYISERLSGGCRLNSRLGKFTYHQNLPEGKVWDCSECKNNHSPASIKRYLTKLFSA